MRYLLLLACVMTAAVMAQPAEPAPESAPPEAGAAPAPDSERGPDHPKKENTRELLEQVMVARLSKELALDDEQTVLLVRAFTDLRDRISEFRKQRSQLINKLKSQLRDGKDDAGIEASLEAVLAHDEKVSKARREIFERVGADLTPWQRAKLYVFMNDFEMDIKKLLKRAQERAGKNNADPGPRPPYERIGRPPMGMPDMDGRPFPGRPGDFQPPQPGSAPAPAPEAGTPPGPSPKSEAPASEHPKP